MIVTVLSTGNAAPTKVMCLRSVASQKGVEVEHVYIEASEQAPPRTRLENIVRACIALPPERIVAWVDGDDWLATDYALARIADDHARGVWATYGSYVRDDGRWGHCAPVVGLPRESPWTASHLKTFRAGLVHRIRCRDVCPGGNWAVDHAPDVAIMLPVLEMAAGRTSYVPELLYVYNYAHSWEARVTERERETEKTAEARWRACDPYKPLTSLDEPHDVSGGATLLQEVMS